jgi:hypothetical protein
VPGKRATLLRPGGYAVIRHDDGRVQEFDTYTCYHCQAIVTLHPGKVPDGGGCHMCCKPICGPCVDLGRCTPFERRIEQEETKDARWRALSKALGL